jgi:hypothetical protein
MTPHATRRQILAAGRCSPAACDRVAARWAGTARLIATLAILGVGLLAIADL